MIPRYLCPFFWDVDRSLFEPRRFPRYTILRILEYGDGRALGWLRRTFSAEQISTVIRHERRLSPKSARFWSLAYGIPKDQIRALGGQTLHTGPG